MADTSNFSHSFIVRSVPFTNRTDTYTNIQKRRENILYRASSNSTNVNLAYIESQDINSSRNLTIDDRSSSLIENKVLVELEDQILEDVSGFLIETDLFLVTNKFTTNLVTQTREPLFYEHVPSVALDTGESYENITVLDTDFNPVLSSQYLIEDDVVYTNLQNEFDPLTGLYEVWWVTYTIRKTSGVLKRYTEILNPVQIFNPAEVEDIDLDTGLIIDGHNVYLITEEGSSFSITLPSFGDWGIRRSSSSRIELLSPPPTDSDDPWFVSIRNGKFIADTTIGLYKYYISEFGVQAFSPFFPYKQADETSYRVSSRIIKVLRDNIVLDTEESIYPEVHIYDENGVFRFALSADPDKLGETALEVGTYYSNVQLGDSKVAGTTLNDLTDPIAGSSIDTADGFIVLPAGYEIKETDTIRAIYNYTEKNYELALFNFNPLSSTELLDRRVAVVVRPEPLGETLTKTIYYLIVNEDGLVLSTDIDFTLSGIDNIDNLISNSGLFYDRNPSGVFWAPSGSIDFVQASTVEGDNPEDSLLILGDIYTREDITPNNLTINDIRVRGGGISQEEITDSVGINPETEWFWDISIWDGKPYPGAASIFVKIPVELLDVASGLFTPEAVKEITFRHMAHGEYPVIHQYNIWETTVTGLDYLDSGIYRINWAPGPPDTLYDIYSLEGENNILFASNISNNYYTATASGLNELQLIVVGRQEDINTGYLSSSIFDVETFTL